MSVWTSAAPTVVASFMASMVEFVEALTIVLAVGVVRGWRSALLGTAAAFAMLAAMVAVLGPALTRIPLAAVQLVVGTLLLLFGLRWLRKAILRAAGVLALHDETKAFEDETALLRKRGVAGPKAFDKVAFGAAFKIVMLEGVEVVFIVIAIGAGGKLLAPASVGAGLALLFVVALGAWLHRPLARVPENALKFGVGVLLSAFGTFWVGEGIGLEWPGADWAVIALSVAYLLVALGLVRLCRQLKLAAARRSVAAKAAKMARKGPLALIGEELLGLFIDDGWLAACVVAWVAAAWLVQQRLGVATGPGALVFTMGLASALGLSASRRARAAES